MTAKKFKLIFVLVRTVHVGNLPANIEENKIEQLFSKIGNVLDVWINPSFEYVTYGFVEFEDAKHVNDACMRFNNYELDFFKLEVRHSHRKTTTTTMTKQKGILLELKKKAEPSKNHILKKIILQNLNENKDINKDFVKAIHEAENIPSPKSPVTTKTNPEPINLLTLEETVSRYYKKPRQKSTLPFEVDIDLSKGRLLTTDEHDRLFNFEMMKHQLNQSEVKPKQSEEKPKRKKIPFELDYRSVCD